MKVLVTGAAEFVGKHVVEPLLAQGVDAGFANILEGYRPGEFGNVAYASSSSISGGKPRFFFQAGRGNFSGLR